MPVGTVKWFDSRKGYGFILNGNGSGSDIFVHFKAIEGNGFRRLVDGETVEYDLDQGPKGLLAIRVKRLASGEDPSI